MNSARNPLAILLFSTALTLHSQAVDPSLPPPPPKATTHILDTNQTGALSELASSAELDLNSYLKLAKSAEEESNFELAEQFYERALNLQIPVEKKHDLLLQMAEGYSSRRSITKAITVYERFCTLFPLDTAKADILLKTGRLYREAGAYKLALDRFYNVLHSVLKIPEGESAVYRAATLTAQFEIAETYFLSADYTKASKFYKLIKLLDLASEDRDRVCFKAIYCEFLQNNHVATVSLAKSFIKDFPNSANLPQTRFILAKTLKATNRPDEALAQVLELLREEKENAKKDPESWAYWRKRAGNQIANEFYNQSDFVNALAIYQSLAKLNETPDWQWPVVFQMGLCFERLRYTPRAIEAFQFIVNEFNKQPEGAPQSDHLTALKQAAQWHIEQLSWKQNTEGQLQTLLAPATATEIIKTSSKKNEPSR